jgi:hypothetical protein
LVLVAHTKETTPRVVPTFATLQALVVLKVHVRLNKKWHAQILVVFTKVTIQVVKNTHAMILVPVVSQKFVLKCMKVNATSLLRVPILAMAHHAAVAHANQEQPALAALANRVRSHLNPNA